MINFRMWLFSSHPKPNNAMHAIEFAIDADLKVRALIIPAQSTGRVADVHLRTFDLPTQNSGVRIIIKKLADIIVRRKWITFCHKRILTRKLAVPPVHAARFACEPARPDRPSAEVVEKVRVARPVWQASQECPAVAPSIQESARSD